MKKPEKMTRKAFAQLNGWSPSYVTKLAQAGRLVFTDNNKKVLVEASLAKIEETKDPNRDDVAARHAKNRVMPPRERYAKALELRKQGLTFKEIGVQLGSCSPTRAAELVKIGEIRQEEDETQGGLSHLPNIRIQNTLRAEGFYLKKDVLHAIKRGVNFYAIPGLGKKSIEELSKWLEINIQDPRKTKQPKKKTRASGIQNHSESRAVKEFYASETAKIEHEKLIGKLCDTASALHTGGEAGTIVRAMLENLPDQLAPVLAVETDENKVHALMVEYIEQLLHDIADRLSATLAKLTEGE